MNRLPLNPLTRWIHELAHRLRCRRDPEYALAALAAAQESAAEFARECWANDSAATLRSLGHDVPVGTVLAGVRVTR
jgi:hypothetical protein